MLKQNNVSVMLPNLPFQALGYITIKSKVIK